MTASSIEPWQVLGSTYPYSDEWISLRSDTVQLPNGTRLEAYHTLEVPDVVNVIALTRAREVVLVEQYRHSVGRTTFEIPAGSIGSGEKPEAAARRELEEETGLGGGAWHYVGTTFTMASRLNNRSHTFFAVDVDIRGKPRPDEAEILQIHRVPWATIMSSVGTTAPLILEANQLAALLLVQQFVERDSRLRCTLR